MLRLDYRLGRGCGRMLTFLLTDVVWAAPWEGAPETATTALARHVSILRGVMDLYGGDMVTRRRDASSTLSVFARATDAVQASRAAQLALATEGWPEGLRPAVRMAIDTGDAVERAGDYTGPAV